MLGPGSNGLNIAHSLSVNSLGYGSRFASILGFSQSLASLYSPYRTFFTASKGCRRISVAPPSQKQSNATRPTLQTGSNISFLNFNVEKCRPDTADDTADYFPDKTCVMRSL